MKRLLGERWRHHPGSAACLHCKQSVEKNHLQPQPRRKPTQTKNQHRALDRGLPEKTTRPTDRTGARDNRPPNSRGRRHPPLRGQVPGVFNTAHTLQPVPSIRRRCNDIPLGLLLGHLARCWYLWDRYCETASIRRSETWGADSAVKNVIDPYNDRQT